jgi:hypothetical protein
VVARNGVVGKAKRGKAGDGKDGCNRDFREFFYTHGDSLKIFFPNIKSRLLKAKNAARSDISRGQIINNSVSNF